MHVRMYTHTHTHTHTLLTCHKKKTPALSPRRTGLTRFFINYKFHSSPSRRPQGKRLFAQDNDRVHHAYSTRETIPPWCTSLHDTAQKLQNRQGIYSRLSLRLSSHSYIFFFFLTATLKSKAKTPIGHHGIKRRSSVALRSPHKTFSRHFTGKIKKPLRGTRNSVHHWPGPPCNQITGLNGTRFENKTKDMVWPVWLRQPLAQRFQEKPFLKPKKWQPGLRRYSLHSFIHLSSILHWAWGMDMKCDPVLILKKLT